MLGPGLQQRMYRCMRHDSANCEKVETVLYILAWSFHNTKSVIFGTAWHILLTIFLPRTYSKFALQNTTLAYSIIPIISKVFSHEIRPMLQNAKQHAELQSVSANRREAL